MTTLMIEDSQAKADENDSIMKDLQQMMELQTQKIEKRLEQEHLNHPEAETQNLSDFQQQLLEKDREQIEAENMQVAVY